MPITLIHHRFSTILVIKKCQFLFFICLNWFEVVTARWYSFLNNACSSTWKAYSVYLNQRKLSNWYLKHFTLSREIMLQMRYPESPFHVISIRDYLISYICSSSVIAIFGKNRLNENWRFQRDPVGVILVIYQNRTTYLCSTCPWPIKLVHRNNFKSTIVESSQVEAL